MSSTMTYEDLAAQLEVAEIDVEMAEAAVSKAKVELNDLRSDPENDIWDIVDAEGAYEDALLNLRECEERYKALANVNDVETEAATAPPNPTSISARKGEVKRLRVKIEEETAKLEELEAIIERDERAGQAVVQSGKAARYGYNRDGSVNIQEQVIFRQVIRLRHAGLSHTNIAKELGRFGYMNRRGNEITGDNVAYIIKQGSGEAKKKDQRDGRAPSYGYRWAGDNEIVENPYEQEIMQEAIKLRGNRLSYQKIAEALAGRGYHNRAGEPVNKGNVSHWFRHCIPHLMNQKQVNQQSVPVPVDNFRAIVVHEPENELGEGEWFEWVICYSCLGLGPDSFVEGGPIFLALDEGGILPTCDRCGKQLDTL